MNNVIARTCTASVMGACFIGILYAPAYVASLSLLLIASIILTTEWPRLVFGWWWLLTPVYPIMPFLAAIDLNQEPVYRPLLFLTILGVVVHDTSAYFIGNLVGTHALCPSISPGKTWEGFFGGVIGVTLFFGVLCYWKAVHTSWHSIVFASSALSSIATLGDLFESWLKRNAGLKDSGALLPGHGGLLDRCDGMMSCMYIVYALRHLAAQLLSLS